ncbi:MAG TPA: ABC transporter ATP-binding protein [Ignavibacteria bacterium]|nr:ABC transporter ATP-binding protein [Ignavibacteria bacterium]
MNNNSNKIIEVRNLVRKYGELTAVNDISFDVYEGEIFGLLGPNGAGKTTTLEIMETLREQTSGEVRVGGFSVSQNKDDVKKIIGVQLQQSGFYPNLTLTELIKLFAGLYNINVNPNDILDMVGLREKAGAIYKNLSGGQKQRFAVATTIINRPKVVFLDEPTTGLDPQARRNLWDLIKSIRESGSTVVITTHYMDEAEKLCDRVGIIDLGKVIELDSPNNLIDNLLAKGFTREEKLKNATLEDVFISLTGKDLRDEQ